MIFLCNLCPNTSFAHIVLHQTCLYKCTMGVFTINGRAVRYKREVGKVSFGEVFGVDWAVINNFQFVHVVRHPMGKEHTHVIAEVELLLGWTGEAKMDGVPKDGGRSGGHHLLSQEGLAACGHALEIVFHQEGFDGRPRGIEDGGLMINLCEKGWGRGGGGPKERTCKTPFRGTRRPNEFLHCKSRVPTYGVSCWM